MELDATSLKLGELLGGKYRIERVLGRGGMGAVYLAENVDIGRKVAIKVLLPELTRDPEVLVRFRNEARAASAIRHPGIVEMIDLGKGPSGEAFLVMEHLEGESLGARLRRVGRLDLPAAAYVVGEVLEAIGAAHAKGIVHRDLKPDNVFLVDQPRPAVKVLDFGISKFHVDAEPALTRTATVMGTPAYMAPEQARSARDAGPASDLYAIGAILYESLGGAPPFEGQSYNEIIAKVMTQPHRPLLEVQPGVPAPIVALVDALLSKDPAARPASAALARERLCDALALSAGTVLPGASSVPDTLRRDQAATLPGASARTRPWLVPALVLLAAFATGASLAVWSLSGPSAGQPPAALLPAASPSGASDASLPLIKEDPEAAAPAGPDAAAPEPPDAATPQRPPAATSAPAPARPRPAEAPRKKPAMAERAGHDAGRPPPPSRPDAAMDDFGLNPYRTEPGR